MSKATDTHYEYVLLLLHANNCCKKAPQCYVTLTWFYLLTPRCRVLLEKLTGLQLVKKFPAFHGTRKFITALTSVRHLSLSRASPIQSIYPHPTSWRSILILSTHLRLSLPSGLFPSGFPTKTHLQDKFHAQITDGHVLVTSAVLAVLTELVRVVV